LPIPGNDIPMKFTKDWRYSITLIGDIFNEQGGYEMADRSMSAEKIFIRNLSISSERNAKRLNWLTAILGIATSALAISEAFKFYTEHQNYFSLYISITLSIAILIIFSTVIRSK